MKELVAEAIPSPVGYLAVALSPEGLARLEFAGEKFRDPVSVLAPRFPDEVIINGSAGEAGEELRRQLDEYFRGWRREFQIPLDLRGPEFRMEVWEELQMIPYGMTTTYGRLAERLGGGARAVGGACASNPVSIVVPCHRVVGADGSLRGFGGGLAAKRFLLELEGADAVRQGLLPGSVSRSTTDKKTAGPDVRRPRGRAQSG